MVFFFFFFGAVKRKSKLVYNQFWCHAKILYSKMLSFMSFSTRRHYVFKVSSHDALFFFFHCQGSADNKCGLKYTANFDSGILLFMLTCVYTLFNYTYIYVYLSIPGSENFPGGGNGNSHQYSCLENPMNRGAQWAIVHGITKSQT